MIYNIIAAATAKSLQSCPTLCYPIDGSPPGSPVPGIVQAGTVEWGAIAFSEAVHYYPPYLTSIQSTSCKTHGWMDHKLESGLPGEISNISDMQIIPL